LVSIRKVDTFQFRSLTVNWCSVADCNSIDIQFSCPNPITIDFDLGFDVDITTTK